MFKFFLVTICFLFAYCNISAQNIKEADLAGSWYPNNPQILKKDINNYLENAIVDPIEGEGIALICPHAGLIYSGDTAAYGFKALENKKVDTVILVGFSHKINFDGIAVFSERGFKTPLGTLIIDRELREKIFLMDKKFFTYPKAFEGENSIELILPFVQTAFNESKILLLALGRQSWENSKLLGETLGKLLEGKDNFLIIASTDLSHYFSSSQAEKIDHETIDLITTMDARALFSAVSGQNRICGLGPVVSTIIAAKRLGANKLKVLKESNSAKVNQDKEKAVGYLSAVLIKKEDAKIKEKVKMTKLLNERQEKELLKLVRDTITLYLNEEKTLEPESEDELFKTVMGVFVTLRRNNQLRGCIGNIVGTQPLYLGVRDMAIAASTQDPRFRPVSKDELKDIHIEVSVLSPLKKITNLEEIIIGKHGVLVKSGFQSGVYLPQVAIETGWEKEEFMNSLCSQKAGLKPDAWKKGECDIYIFTAEVFEE